MKVLAADIGGTNARFAVVEANPSGVSLLQKKTFSSGTTSFNAILQEIQDTWDAARELDRICVAAAGPVDNGYIKMTNAAFDIDARLIKQHFPKACVSLINDFEAQALGLASENVEDDLETIYSDGIPFASPLRTVIGAGTGFGTGWLLLGQPLRVIASELGHIALAFDEAEAPIARFFEKHYPETPITIEHILSGRGLTLLNAFFTGKMQSPADITSTGEFEKSETCAAFSRFYGRAARTAALTALTQSIVIGGGIARKCPALIRHANFLSEFLRYKGPHLAYLKRVRLFLDKTGNLGLRGALVKAVETNKMEGE